VGATAHFEIGALSDPPGASALQAGALRAAGLCRLSPAKAIRGLMSLWIADSGYNPDALLLFGSHMLVDGDAEWLNLHG
jgi:hypothetical protein